MKTVPPERWREIEALLDEVLDLPTADRPAFLSARCAADPALRAAVESLVVACEQPTAAALSPVRVVEPLLADLATVTPAGDGLPEHFGAWRVIREIGHGGMGTVLLAERADDQFRKQVAIKVLKRGMRSPEMVERFRSERQILASLDHPGIARLIDGGIAGDGSPYLVMEYIEGQPLDAWCRDRQATINQRLAVFHQVARAVQYAHEQLIVHRDLKPSNILVTADGRARLLDFGIAKLVDDDAGGLALTRTGMRVMTPEYASPEQVRGERITAATDVYALGVILYELLAGRRPYSLENRSLSEIERIICHTEPPRPSAAIDPPGSSLGAEPLRRRLRGDLDTITLKALAKDPARRYHSVAALVDDLARYQAGRPVLARPDTFVYRASKFARRHAAGLVAVAVLVALVAGAAVRERTLRARAEAEAAAAHAAREFLANVFAASDPYATAPARGADVTAQMLLDRGAERVDTALAGNPELQAEMLTILGRIYGNLSLYDRAAPILERAVERRRRSGPAVHLSESLAALGAVYIRQARYADAESLLREAVEIQRHAGAAPRGAPGFALDRLATAIQQQGRHDEAEPLFREVLARRRAHHGGDAHLDVTESLNNLGLIRWFKGDYAGAESLYQRSMALRRAIVGPSHPLTAEVMHNVAQAKQLQGELDSAEVLFRESLAMKRTAFGDAHPSVTVHLNNLGRLLRERGRYAEAEPLLREALALDRRIFGPVHPYVAASLDNVAGLLSDVGRFREAETHYRQALDVNRTMLGEEHTAVALNENGIATTLFRQGNLAAAESLYRRAADRYARLLGPDSRNAVVVAGNLANVLRERGTLAEAESLQRRVVAHLEAARPATRTRLGPALVALGRTLVAARRATEAESLLVRGLERCTEDFGENDWRTAEARLGLGQALVMLGRRAEGADHLRRSQMVLAGLRVRQPLLARQAEAAVRGLP